MLSKRRSLVPGASWPGRFRSWRGPRSGIKFVSLARLFRRRRPPSSFGAGRYLVAPSVVFLAQVLGHEPRWSLVPGDRFPSHLARALGFDRSLARLLARSCTGARVAWRSRPRFFSSVLCSLVACSGGGLPPLLARALAFLLRCSLARSLARSCFCAGALVRSLLGGGDRIFLR